ncbi:MAG TPA: hypothetical protein VI168_16210 [Croceibacterium sp.]
MIALASLLVAQVLVTSGDGLSVEQKVEILARATASRSTGYLEIFDQEPAVGLEIKRVGLDAGCPLVWSVARSTSARYLDDLMPRAQRAVREVIPLAVVESMTRVSYLAGLAMGYTSRVDRKFDEVAVDLLSRAHSEAAADALAGLARLPDLEPVTATEPALAPVFQNSFGASPDEVWNSVPLLAIACLQRTAPRDGSLHIESGGETFPENGDAQ